MPTRSALRGQVEWRGEEENKNPSTHLSAQRCDGRRDGSPLTAATRPCQPAHEPSFPPIPPRAATSTTGAWRTPAHSCSSAENGWANGYRWRSQPEISTSFRSAWEQAARDHDFPSLAVPPRPLMACFAARPNPGPGSTFSNLYRSPFSLSTTFPLPLMTSLAARAVHATSTSSKLITFAFPSTMGRLGISVDGVYTSIQRGCPTSLHAEAHRIRADVSVSLPRVASRAEMTRPGYWPSRHYSADRMAAVQGQMPADLSLSARRGTGRRAPITS
jgi:hypothetical protein